MLTDVVKYPAFLESCFLDAHALLLLYCLTAHVCVVCTNKPVGTSSWVDWKDMSSISSTMIPLLGEFCWTIGYGGFLIGTCCPLMDDSSLAIRRAQRFWKLMWLPIWTSSRGDGIILGLICSWFCRFEVAERSNPKIIYNISVYGTSYKVFYVHHCVALH